MKIKKKIYGVKFTKKNCFAIILEEKTFLGKIYAKWLVCDFVKSVVLQINLLTLMFF